MKRILILTGSILLIFAISNIVLNIGHTLAKEKTKVSLPLNSIEVGPDVYYLGTAKDKDGRFVEGYAFIHRDKYAHTLKPPRSSGSVCYAFLAKGAKWKTNESWIVNPNNTRGLNEQFVLGNLVDDIKKWEGTIGKDILGAGSKITGVLEADTSSPDGKNEVYFADVDSLGAIAITIVWGYFGGSIQSRQLIEWDQVYDDIDYDWSSTGETGKMDFENIATHELGHSLGLDDLYTASCNQETMYGYADYGEILKRDLNAGDIAGLKELYK